MSLLANSYRLEKKYSASLELYNKMLHLEPSDDKTLNNIGIVLNECGKLDEAYKYVYEALKINPKNFEAHNNMGVILCAQKKYKKSIDAFRTAIKLNCSFLGSYYGLGMAYFEMGRFGKAIKSFKDTIKIDNKHYNSHNALVWPLVLKGKFKEGWKSYEYRWKVDPLNKVKWPIEGRDLWEGQHDRDVVLWREQGIGDELIFLGLVPEARDLSRSVSVYIDKRLIPLCERSMPDIRFLSKPEQIGEQEFDYHLPMGSLPRLLRSSAEDFEKTVKGYLKADADRVEVLRQELNVGDRKIIGISWKSIKSLNHLKKSLTLMEFGKIFQDLDVVLLNLQYGAVDEEIKAFERDTGIEIIQCSSVDNREDLDGLAALIELCDLVVSTSNVTIHLAGALGKDTWVLLPYVANFWWLLERTDSVWYPSLTLYRQKTLKDWDSVALDLKEDLKKKFNT